MKKFVLIIVKMRYREKQPDDSSIVFILETWKRKMLVIVVDQLHKVHVVIKKVVDSQGTKHPPPSSSKRFEEETFDA